MQSSSRNGAKVVWLALHTTEGMMRAQALRDWTSWAGSSHASNDETGVLMTPADGFVPYDRAAWTLRNGNAISENIEQCGWARWTRAEWLARPKLIDTTARWLADRSKARGIPLVRLSDADIRAKRPGVLGHGDYSRATGDGTHTDPGPNYPWDVVLDKARAYAAGQPIQEDDVPLTTAEIERIATRAAETTWATAQAGKGPWAIDRLAGIDGNVGIVRTELAALRATVDTLAKAVAAQQDTVDEAALLKQIDDSIMAATVKVTVAVDRPTA